MFEEETMSERQIEDFFDDYIAKYNNLLTSDEKLLFGTKYILWLNNFTKKYNSFSDDQWLFDSDEISDADLNQVQHLGTIYNMIESYANKYYIFPDKNDEGEYYCIKLDDNAYEIGMTSFLDGAYFCNKVPVEDSYIDLKDIISDKVPNDIKAINDKLKQLGITVESLYNSGVPLEAISMTVRQKIQDLEVRQEYDGMKRLVK